MLEDLTGGFNYGSGTVEVQCPPDVRRSRRSAGRRLHWLRCRIADDPTRVAGERRLHPAARDLPDHARRRSARCSAPSTPRSRSRRRSASATARPGQTFAAAVLAGARRWRDGETLEVASPAATGGPQWGAVDSFAGSGPDDRHFKLDANGGEIGLGPAVREPDGGVDAVRGDPAQGRDLRMSRYRHGGGRDGNVAADTLTMLRSAIPGVASVTNPRPALRRRRSRVARVGAPARARWRSAPATAR